MLKRMQWISLVACCLLGAVMACVLMVRNWNRVTVVRVAKAQDAQTAGSKYVEIEPDSPRFAAKVVNATVGGQVVTPGYFNPRKGPSGVPFQAGDDWLKELTFTIKNRSSKTFVWLYVDVLFPDTMATGAAIGKNIELGRIPENAAYTDQGKKPDQGSKRPLALRPGQEMEISLAPYADDIRRRIEERQPFSTIGRCFINLTLGYFEDGMMWSLADYNVPDPSHYPWYKRADESEIPVKDKRATYAPNEPHD